MSRTPASESKFLTPELKQAAADLAAIEIVDEREERLKAIWPSVKDALARGMTHRDLYARLKGPIGNGKELKFSSFTKLVGKLSARGKKKSAKAQPDVKPAIPVKATPISKPTSASASTATPPPAAE
ncbi:MAG: hypothetical protein ACK5U4_13650 [Rhodospirillales bacterium]|jgi:hypothetical protein